MPSPRVGIVGGSIGGLCAGIALQAAHYHVEIHERSPRDMASRGAGIVVQPELLRVVALIPGAALPMTQCLYRRYVQAQDGSEAKHAAPQTFTSWEAIYATLRSGFPRDRYAFGSALTSFHGQDKRVTGVFSDAAEKSFDLLLCADGFQSETRQTVLPDVQSAYAGYVAWRGVVDEADLPEPLRAWFDDAFSFCEARSGGHMLCYFIPGEGNATNRGARRLNWVWYVNVREGEALDDILVDETGRRHAYSLHPGAASPRNVQTLYERARVELTSSFADLVGITPDPFLQVIFDLFSPKLVFDRVCLMGDAAIVVRPHTAGGTAKAAGDALALADALQREPDIDRALVSWERNRLAYGLSLMNYGIALGKRTAR
ncbi:MAG: hypothetical protein ACREPQ_17720 [Rhodanobacter sp.]